MSAAAPIKTAAMSTTKIIRTIIMGAPASGKGTISGRIIKHFNMHYLASGDILRKNIQSQTLLGMAAQKYIKDGQLVPDDLMIKCILDKLKQIPTNQSWLLDGFPRTIEQANQLSANQTVDIVLNLDVPNDVIIDRVQGRWVHLNSGRVYNIGFNKPKVPFTDDLTGEPLIQRPDDQPDIVQNRLDIYDKQTKPLIEYYKSLGILVNFPGRTSDEIWPKVKECLEEKILNMENAR